MQNRAARTERRTHPGGLAAKDAGNGVVAFLQFLIQVRGRYEREIRMCLRVIADCVAARRDFADKRRLCRSVTSDQEERGSRLVPIEKIEQCRGYGWIWAVVEREGQRVRIVREANGPTEELRPRCECSPGKRARTGTPSNRDTGGKLVHRRKIVACAAQCKARIIETVPQTRSVRTVGSDSMAGPQHQTCDRNEMIG